MNSLPESLKTPLCGKWRTFFLRTAVCIAGLPALCFAAAGEEISTPEEEKPAFRMERPLSAAESPGFSIPQLTLRPGESAMIAIQIPEPVDHDSVYVHSLSGLDRIAVLSRPMILKGHRIGFVRLQALRKGITSFKIGQSILEINVRETTENKPSAAGSALTPSIITPVAGAAVWGEFAVGVEGLLDASGTAPSEVWIENGRGKKWKADGLDSAPAGSHYRAVISVTSNDLHDGSLQPVARWDREEKRGERIFLSAVRPDDTHQFADEAENLAVITVPRVNAQTDEDLEMEQPEVSSQQDASGGRAVSMPSGNPPLRGKFEIRASGLYQMFVNAGGDFGGGAWPSVGIGIDDAEDRVAVSRLGTGAMHRLPVGRPFHLEEGERVIAFHFLNDFHTKGSDRNLMLDRFELARVDLRETAESGLVTALRDMFHGAEVAGPVDIRVETHWKDRGGASARVELWINGEPFAVQYGPQSSFRVEPANLRAGKNVIHAVAALPSGESHQSPPQMLVLREAEPGRTAVASREWRVTPVDPAWDPGMRQRLRKEGDDNPAFTAEFFSNGESILTLPHDMQGRFEVWMDGRADVFQGEAMASLSRVSGDEREFLGEASFRGRLDTRKLGELECKAGKNQLALAFVNDAYEEGKGDRNLYLQALRFRPLDDAAPDVPVFEVLYPATGSTPGQTDAVVVRWFSSSETPVFDLEINGQPLGLRCRPSRLDGGAGLVTIPWPAQDLEPGKHQLRVIAQRGSESVRSAPLELAIGGKPPRDGPYERALHLLDRLAFGPDPAALGELLTTGETAWLKDRIFSEDTMAVEAALAAQQVLFAKRGRGNGQVVQQALHGAVEGLNPVRDRFVFWAQNHFSTWIGKTGATEKLDEHRAFYRAGIPSFESLLAVSVRSPAMLVYLDQQRSFHKRINENYARELLELHTVGVHGGYSQEDVTALARLLTGWMTAEVSSLHGVSREMVKEFRFDPAVSDTSEHRVFGYTFEAVEPGDAFARISVLFEMLAAHPATAGFISKKLAEHYVAAPAPQRLVKDLTREFLATRGDLQQVLYHLATHEDFLASAAAPRVAQPLDYAVRLARMTGSNQTGKLQGFLAKSGTGLFDRSTPDGYPQTDASYVNSNAMLQRWNIAWDFRSALQHGIPQEWRSADALSTEDGRRKFSQAVSLHLTGRPLSPRSLEALEKMTAREKFIHSDLLAVLVAQMPEANLK